MKINLLWQLCKLGVKHSELSMSIIWYGDNKNPESILDELHCIRIVKLLQKFKLYSIKLFQIELPVIRYIPIHSCQASCFFPVLQHTIGWTAVILVEQSLDGLKGAYFKFLCLDSLEHFQ